MNEKERFIRLVTEKLHAEADSVTMRSRFTEDLGADSLLLFEILTEAEEQMGVELPAEERNGILSVGDAFEALRRAGQ
jgi:acyl carrier protein